MESEKEIIISFLFKRSGKELLRFSDLYLALSMDLNWFTPDDAKTFINMALKQNILTKKGEFLKPNFNYEKTIIPVGFSPSKKVFEIKEEKKKVKEEDSVLENIITLLSDKTDLKRAHIIELINSITKEKNITEEVAALLVGKQYNIYFDEFYEKIEEIIFK